LHVSRHVVALVVALSALPGLLGIVASWKMSDRVGRRATVACGVIASALTSAYAYSGGESRFIVGYLVGITRLPACSLRPPRH
jgi:MFS family permease